MKNLINRLLVYTESKSTTIQNDIYQFYVRHSKPFKIKAIESEILKSAAIHCCNLLNLNKTLCATVQNRTILYSLF